MYLHQLLLSFCTKWFYCSLLTPLTILSHNKTILCEYKKTPLPNDPMPRRPSDFTPSYKRPTHIRKRHSNTKIKPNQIQKNRNIIKTFTNSRIPKHQADPKPFYKVPQIPPVITIDSSFPPPSNHSQFTTISLNNLDLTSSQSQYISPYSIQNPRKLCNFSHC